MEDSGLLMIIVAGIGGFLIILTTFIVICKAKRKYCFEHKKVENIQKNEENTIRSDFDEINSPQKESNSKIIIAPSVSVAQPARVNWQDPKEIEKIVKE